MPIGIYIYFVIHICAIHHLISVFHVSCAYYCIWTVLHTFMCVLVSFPPMMYMIGWYNSATSVSQIIPTAPILRVRVHIHNRVTTKLFALLCVKYVFIIK